VTGRARAPRAAFLLVLLVAARAAAAAPAEIPWQWQRAPELFPRVDLAVGTYVVAVKKKKLMLRGPSWSVVVGRGDQVVFRKAYGQRAIQPSPEPMTMDTIFDLASLTKPSRLATSRSVPAPRFASRADTVSM